MDKYLNKEILVLLDQKKKLEGNVISALKEIFYELFDVAKSD